MASRVGDEVACERVEGTAHDSAFSLWPAVTPSRGTVVWSRIGLHDDKRTGVRPNRSLFLDSDIRCGTLETYTNIPLIISKQIPTSEGITFYQVQRFGKSLRLENNDVIFEV